MIPLLALAACMAVPAASDKIVAGDLAERSHAFAALDPTAFVGWAPAPGVRRFFTVAELRRTAARLGAAEMPEAALCMERKTTVLDPAKVLAALQAQIMAAEVKLLDFSRTPVPEGELVFPRSGFRPIAGAAYWNGYVTYAGGRRFAVWARMALAVPTVVAAVDLAPGRIIEAVQLRIESRADLSGLRALDGAAGKCPRRLIRGGTAILQQWLDAPAAIARGDTVTVEVESGGTRLRLDARAETSAALGDRITLRNPASEKRFDARVEGKGRASVATPGHEAKP